MLIAIFWNHVYGSEDSIKTLKREITLLNLLNGLNLAIEQEQEILDAAKKAKAIREEARQRYRRIENELNEALVTLREALYDRNSTPPREVERRAARLNHEARNIQEDAARKLQLIEKEVEEILTPGQIEIVQDFKPCIIPPKDLKNPLRAGQAFNPSPFERFLERIRDIPVMRYRVVRERLAEKYIEKMELHQGRMSAIERTKKKKELLNTMDKVRDMTDEEFALEKGEVISSLAQDFKGINPVSFRSRDGIGPIGKFLLDEKIIPILEKRLSLASKFNSTGNSGLMYISANEGGTCALYGR
jgi:hypothetical protein